MEEEGEWNGLSGILMKKSAGLRQDQYLVVPWQLTAGMQRPLEEQEEVEVEGMELVRVMVT